MVPYSEVRGTVEVPKNAGKAGFLRAIESVLALPRLQEIRVDARGKVEFRYFLREGEEQKTTQPDFTDLLPYAVIRNSEVRELSQPDTNAAVAVSQLFDLVSADRLFPIAFAVGPSTTFWRWYRDSTDIDPLSTEELCGIPLLSDHLLEDYVLVLCAGFSRHAALADTQRSYKLVIPQVKA